VHKTVAIDPPAKLAHSRIETRRGTGRLAGLDLAMPADTYRNVRGDGIVQRKGDRVDWQPPREGGTLRYDVVIPHQRRNGQYDARITPDWMIVRGDRLFPSARVRATKDSGSTARLSIVLPKGWPDAETPFSKVSGGYFAVTSAERRFDRPVGWIAAGDLASVRETIDNTRVTITTPRGDRVDQVAMLAILRQALPEMGEAFGTPPEKLLIVRSGDPMWRGGLSAPRSLWLHADRPLISENGTSTLLHELTHVLTDIRGSGKDDWIAEGLAEYSSLEISRRAGLISQKRFDHAIENAGAAGAGVASLRATESKRDRTRKAVALFASLGDELRTSKASLDALARLLSRRQTVSLPELRTDAAKLLGKPSLVLAEAR
jgi:predicted metalloprotease with PDZ domain